MSPSFPSSPPGATPRPLAVILGSGRSGTSLLMQVLAALGMRVSEHLIAPRRDNPQGFYEDAAIVGIQADLLRALGAWPYHPLPADWLARPAATAAREALTLLLRQRLAATGLWGFKDPRTAAFLPLWQAVFAAEGLRPRYLLALRQPGPILRSFMAAYATPAAVAEAVWLRRTCDALWHTRGHCHIVHYEDWFSRPAAVAQGLARFLQLPAPAAEALHAIVRPDLNRAAPGPGAAEALQDPQAQTLWTFLTTCRGEAWDRTALLQQVQRCRATGRA